MSDSAAAEVSLGRGAGDVYGPTMASPVLITGATGTVGAPVTALLRERGVPVRPASRRPEPPDGVGLDFTDPLTWPAAVEGVRTVFFLRPPQIGRVRRDLLPFLELARRAGVEHVVLLSVQGADRVPVLPHAHLEKWLRGSGLGWTFVRPSYFAQNLSTTFGPDVRDRDRIVVPAGSGRTAIVDALDVAEVVAAVLADPGAHRGRAWTPTGPALTYDEVAAVLGRELGRRIRYTRPGLVAYFRHAHRVLGMPAGMVAVTAALHLTARLGLAATETDDVRALTGHPPADFATFAHRERAAWIRDESTADGAS